MKKSRRAARYLRFTFEQPTTANRVLRLSHTSGVRVYVDGKMRTLDNSRLAWKVERGAHQVLIGIDDSFRGDFHAVWDQ